MVRVSQFMECSRPGTIESLEHAHTVLRMHKHCSEHMCDSRREALAYIDRIVSPDPDEDDEGDVE